MNLTFIICDRHRIFHRIDQNNMFRVEKKKIVLSFMFVVSLVFLLHPDMNARSSYEYTETKDILSTLYEELANNFTSSAMVDCEYREVIYDDTTLSPALVDGDLIEGHRIKEGGEYAPSDCKPKFSTAIIVPYRDRAEQLRGFLIYMHMFLRHQKIHYRIYVVEQIDTKPFNRAKLLNIGAGTAAKAGYPCLVLHDVDLLPLRIANLYACSKRPRHMSSCINKFRFVLPYLQLFGGAVALTTPLYTEVNGMSNEYWGWGGEDDDLAVRLAAAHQDVERWSPTAAIYHMMHHADQPKSLKRKKLLRAAQSRMDADGLNSLQYTEVATVLHPLFTHIVVDL